MLACHWLWRSVNRQAKGSSNRQAAKFLVHYEAFQSLRDVMIPRARTFIEAAERNDRTVIQPLEHALDALFGVALAAHRVNQTIDGHRVAIRPYHQRKDVDVYANFVREWNGNPTGRWQLLFERRAAEFEESLKA